MTGNGERESNLDKQTSLCLPAHGSQCTNLLTVTINNVQQHTKALLDVKRLEKRIGPYWVNFSAAAERIGPCWVNFNAAEVQMTA